MEKKKVLSSLVLSGTMLVMAPQAWSQTGGTSGAGKSESGAQTQEPRSGQQRSTPGSSSELQSERGGARGAMQGQTTAGQRLSKDQVKQIQEALKDKGQDPGQADGIMGPKTQQALRAFQKSQNLQVTGRVDEQTADALGVDISSSSMGASPSGSSAPGARSSSPSGSGAAAGSRSGSKSSGTDATNLGKGSTAGKQESTEGNPK